MPAAEPMTSVHTRAFLLVFDFCAVSFWIRLPALARALRAFFIAFLSPVRRTARLSMSCGVSIAASEAAAVPATFPALSVASGRYASIRSAMSWT